MRVEGSEIRTDARIKAHFRSHCYAEKRKSFKVDEVVLRNDSRTKRRKNISLGRKTGGVVEGTGRPVKNVGG